MTYPSLVYLFISLSAASEYNSRFCLILDKYLNIIYI